MVGCSLGFVQASLNPKQSQTAKLQSQAPNPEPRPLNPQTPKPQPDFGRAGHLLEELRPPRVWGWEVRGFEEDLFLCSFVVCLVWWGVPRKFNGLSRKLEEKAVVGGGGGRGVGVRGEEGCGWGGGVWRGGGGG